MTCQSRRYCPCCSIWPMARHVRQSWAQKTSSSWVSVRHAQCCSRRVREKDPKFMWDTIYGFIDGNQCNNWAGDGGGSSVRSWSGSRRKIANKPCSVVHTWPVNSPQSQQLSRHTAFPACFYVIKFIFYLLATFADAPLTAASNRHATSLKPKASHTITHLSNICPICQWTYQACQGLLAANSRPQPCCLAIRPQLSPSCLTLVRGWLAPSPPHYQNDPVYPSHEHIGLLPNGCIIYLYYV